MQEKSIQTPSCRHLGPITDWLQLFIKTLYWTKSKFSKCSTRCQRGGSAYGQSHTFSLDLQCRVFVRKLVRLQWASGQPNIESKKWQGLFKRLDDCNAEWSHGKSNQSLARKRQRAKVLDKVCEKLTPILTKYWHSSNNNQTTHPK